MTSISCTHFIYFSPTHTSEKIARAIAEGIGMEKRIETDLTIDESDRAIEIDNTLAIIAAPVYGGRIAPIALQRFKRLHATSSPVILVAVYGNRDYEDALVELYDACSTWGFTPLSAGAFIGEHSFSTEKRPIAHGRPDEKDLISARKFGKESYEKLQALLKKEEQVTNKTSPKNITDFLQGFHVKGHRPYKLLQPSRPSAPVSTSQCFGCGECIPACPTHAIVLNAASDKIETDIHKCIRCCACVKACPIHARVYTTPFAALLHEKCSLRREPELFF